MLDKFWDYFAGGGRVNEWLGFKNDMGHTATAGTVAYGLVLLGVVPLLATLIAAVGCAVIQETADGFRFAPPGRTFKLTRDTVSDVISYQLLWPIFLLTVNVWIAFAALVVIFTAYVGAVLRKIAP